MPRWARVALTEAAVVAVLGVAGLVGLYVFVVRGMCANEPLSVLLSPDEKLSAVVFQRSCGATTGFSTQISVVRSGRALPNDGGNLFVADTDHGRAPRGLGGGPEVRLSWVGPRSLRIAYHRNARVFRAEQNAAGVSAEYVMFP